MGYNSVKTQTRAGLVFPQRALENTDLIPSHSSKPTFRIAKAIGLTAAVLVCQGSFCGERSDPPTLPGATLVDIHLLIEDPALSTQGIYLGWSYPSDANATYFEIYQGLNRDSLRHAVLAHPAKDSQHVVLALTDNTRPFTIYFGVRAVYVEPTGQKMVSGSMAIDSISVTPSLKILQPVSGSFMAGRELEMAVQTNSDPGVVIRFAYYEETGPGWGLKQEGWLPLGEDPTPIFGGSVQRGTRTLEQHPETDTVTALFCVVGTETFEERHTGQIQSLGCNRFFRVGQ